ncbi:ubiquitin-protein ligase E3A-like isoform X2 [Bolinopsis microptera]|uniref:ubiquitin-protein ligase E3A-like isoform X2 n=1 Tax=Bolinopsis microptera TaxID=2820187 RepID=UPI00307A0884
MNGKVDIKKKKLQCVIKQQHLILTQGCGAKKCKNEQCVSSGKTMPMDPNSAAKCAIDIYRHKKDSLPDAEVLSSHEIFSLVNHSSGPLYELLTPTLKSVLSDPDKLSKSFTQVGISTAPGIVTIDKDALEESYEILFNLDNPELEETICDSFSDMVALLLKRVKDDSKESKNLINCFVILLLNPRLQNPEYAGGCLADLCACLSVLRNGYKVNLIHYISTLPSDTITEMIYNFQQVIAIGIALREDEDETLHKTKAVCDGVTGLQLLYGAVVYRAQHTIHHVLGDLSMTKQLSREISTPVTPYTSNNLIEVISSSSGVVVADDTDSAASEVEMSRDTGEAVRSGNGPDDKTNSVAEDSSSVVAREPGYSNPDQKPSDSNPITNQTLNEPIKQPESSSSPNTDTGRSGNGPDLSRSISALSEENSANLQSASDVLFPLLAAMEGDMAEFEDLEDLEDGDEDDEDEGDEDDQNNSPPVESARRLLDFASPVVDGDDTESSDEDDPLTSFFRIQMNGLLSGRSRSRRPEPTPKLFTKLGIKPLWDSHTNIDLSLFYNDNISQELKMDEDYINYKSGKGFAFLHYPFVLRPHVKSVGLQFDNRINMNRSVNPFLLLMSGEYPYLKLVVKRNNLVEDALTHLEMVAEEEPQQLQRQLYVEFEGEEGVDEGGVSKEFFQLIIAELFNPNYGMFVDIEDTRMLWFNPQSFEVDHNYKLIGMLLGLAVYNNIILDIRFPTVLYQKLMGEQSDIRDLILTHPLLGSSLQQLLDYPDEDVEEVFMLDFVASTTGLFGETITHHLVEGGDEIPVTSDNKHEFVSKYVDYVLNTSVSKQFDQFKKGFDMVASHSPLKSWFRPEELEKLIVGTHKLDFKALQTVARYDNGYTADSDVVKWFWEVTHAMTDEDKSKLLAFSTGCGRAPVGGMSEMNFIVVKNGGDSERLPTAHTCFNVLLLPEYSSKDKLKSKLFSAIQHFEGFGMI